MRLWAACFMLLVSTACAQTRAPLPTLGAPIRVGISPSLTNLYPLFGQCVESIPDLTILYTVTYLPEEIFGELDIAFTFGEQNIPDSHAFQLGSEEIVVIRHPDNPVDTLPLESLAGILTGYILNWEDLGPGKPAGELHAWGYPPSADVRNAFLPRLLDRQVEAPTTYIAPGPREMLEAVSTDPAAIGYLPASWVDEKVRTIEITDLTDNVRTSPILAYTHESPAGNLKSMLLCLQSSIQK